MFRYGVYARKSDTDESKTEKSSGEQLGAVDELIERDSLHVVWREDESESAKIPRCRPIYSELIALIEKGKIDAVLCWHINRLVRNMEEGGKLAQLVIDGTIKEIRTPHSTYKAGDNIMPLVIEAAMATQYSIDLSRDVSRSMDGSFRQGGTIHRAPQGYMNSRDPSNLRRGIVLIDPERFPLIRKAWDLLLTGEVTPLAILHSLNEEWGYRVRHTKKCGNKPLSASSIYALFRNPYYAGFVQKLGELERGRHQPMVTVEEFERAQIIMDQHSRRRTRRLSFTYTGLMRCAYCKYQVTGEKRVLRNGSKWENYRCSDAAHLCTKRGISHTKLEQKFEEYLRRIVIAPEVIQVATEQLLLHIDEREKVSEAVEQQQLRAVEGVKARIHKVEEMWINGLVTDPERYRELLAKETREKNELLKSMTDGKEKWQRARENVRAIADYFSIDFDAFRLKPSDDKRGIVNALGEIKFYGREKLVEVILRPVLAEFVRFSESISESLAPPKSCSGNQKEPTFARSILYGGRESNRLAPIVQIPLSLCKALEDPILGSVFPRPKAGITENTPTLRIGNGPDLIHGSSLRNEKPLNVRCLGREAIAPDTLSSELERRLRERARNGMGQNRSSTLGS